MFKNSCLEKAEEKIVKLGENKVAIQKVLYDKQGNEVVVYQEDYGEIGINEMMSLCDNEISNLQKANQQIQKIQEKKAKLLQVKTKLKEK